MSVDDGHYYCGFHDHMRRLRFGRGDGELRPQHLPQSSFNETNGFKLVPFVK